MSLLRTSAVAAILSTSLILSGCNKKDTEETVKSTEVENVKKAVSSKSHKLAFNEPSTKSFDHFFAVKTRKVSDSEAEAALRSLGLSNKNKESLTWDKRSGSDGNYEFTNVKAVDDENTMTAKKLVIKGLRQVDEQTTFDRVDIAGIKVVSSEDDGVATIKSISLAHPDTAFDLDFSDFDSLDIDDGELGLGAFKIEGVTFTESDDDVSVSLGELIYGLDKEAGKFDFKIKDIDLSAKPEDVGPISLDFGTFYGVGIDKRLVDDGKIEKNLSPGLNNLGSSFPMSKYYDHYALDKMHFDSEFLTIHSEGMAGIAEEKGDIITLRQKSDPLTLTFKDAPGFPEAAQAYQILKSLDLMNFVITTGSTQTMDKGSDSLVLENGFIDIKDELKLSSDYKLTGLKAMMDRAETQQGSNLDVESMLQDMELHNLTIRLDDQALVERLMKLAGEMQGSSPSIVKTEITGLLTIASLMGQTDLQKDVAKMLLSNLPSFLDGGKTMTITLNPETPLDGPELMSLAEKDIKAKDIGLTIKTK